MTSAPVGQPDSRTRLDAQLEDLKAQTQPSKPLLHLGDAAELVETILKDQIPAADRQWLIEHGADPCFDKEAKNLFSSVLQPNINLSVLQSTVDAAVANKAKADFAPLFKDVKVLQNQLTTLNERVKILQSNEAKAASNPKLRASAAEERDEIASREAQIALDFHTLRGQLRELQGRPTSKSLRDAYDSQCERIQGAFAQLRQEQIAVEVAFGGPEDQAAIAAEAKCLSAQTEFTKYDNLQLQWEARGRHGQFEFAAQLERARGNRAGAADALMSTVGDLVDRNADFVALKEKLSALHTRTNACDISVYDVLWQANENDQSLGSRRTSADTHTVANVLALRKDLLSELKTFPEALKKLREELLLRPLDDQAIGAIEDKLKTLERNGNIEDAIKAIDVWLAAPNPVPHTPEPPP